MKDIVTTINESKSCTLQLNQKEINNIFDAIVNIYDMLKHDADGSTPEMREYERLFTKIQKTVKMSSIKLDDDYSMPLKKAKVSDYDDEYDDGHKHDYYYYSH